MLKNLQDKLDRKNLKKKIQNKILPQTNFHVLVLHPMIGVVLYLWSLW